MKLRTFGAALAGVLLTASLAACGGGQESTEATSTETTNAEAKVYSIATDTAFAPFEFTDESGNLVGVDIDILSAIAEDQGFEYTVDSIGFDASKQAVQQGQDDGMIAGMSITDERKETFDFSDPYYDSTVCCAVAADSKVASLSDLKGENVAVKTGTQSLDWAKSISKEYGFTMTEFADSDVMYQDVLAGNSAACFEDTPTMGYAINSSNVGLKIIAEVDSTSEFFSQYGFAVKKGENAELLEMFNTGLANIKANGKYDEILAKYISTSADATTAAAAATTADATATDATATDSTDNATDSTDANGEAIEEVDNGDEAIEEDAAA